MIQGAREGSTSLMSRFTFRILGAVVSQLFPKKNKLAEFQCQGANMTVESHVAHCTSAYRVLSVP